MSKSEDCDVSRLPVGLLDFSNIIEKNKIYVDKTGLMYKIAAQDAPIFLSRPRRFGKSLLINTLATLFSRGLDYFHGLDIESFWKDKTYQVVHLDFSSIASKNHKKFSAALGERIIEEFCAGGSVSQFNEQGVRDPDSILNEIARKLNNNSVVLLVDEYDAPLTHHINEPDELHEIMSIMNDFYAIIKQYADKFRLIFISGIAKLSYVSIFSGFNNLVDISIDDEFNNLLGFTKEELLRYFDLYAENSAKVLCMRKDEVYQRLEQYYDGFQFSVDAKDTLYNPWSILNFFRNPKRGFVNYWLDSDETSFLINYLKMKEDFDFLDYDQCEIIVDNYAIGCKYEIKNIPYNILLFQTGYFTIRKIADGMAALVVTNKEIQESLYRLYLAANNLSPNDGLRKRFLEFTSAIDHKAVTFHFRDEPLAVQNKRAGIYQ